MPLVTALISHFYEGRAHVAILIPATAGLWLLRLRDAHQLELFVARVESGGAFVLAYHLCGDHPYHFNCWGLCAVEVDFF